VAPLTTALPPFPCRRAVTSFGRADADGSRYLLGDHMGTARTCWRWHTGTGERRSAPHTCLSGSRHAWPWQRGPPDSYWRSSFFSVR